MEQSLPLLAQMLQFQPQKRNTIAELLNHAIFTKVINHDKESQRANPLRPTPMRPIAIQLPDPFASNWKPKQFKALFQSLFGTLRSFKVHEKRKDLIVLAHKNSETTNVNQPSSIDGRKAFQLIQPRCAKQDNTYVYTTCIEDLKVPAGKWVQEITYDTQWCDFAMDVEYRRLSACLGLYDFGYEECEDDNVVWYDCGYDPQCTTCVPKLKYKPTHVW